MVRQNSHRDPERRYPLLRLAGSAFMGLGMFLLAAGVVFLAVGLYTLAAGMLGGPTRPNLPPDRPTIHAVPILRALGGSFAAVWGGGFLFSGLQCVAMGALCRLAIQVEANTRASAEHLARIRSRAEPAREDVARFFVS